MEFSKPQHNSFGFYRVDARDSDDSRVCVKEVPVHRNETCLRVIIDNRNSITLSREDAAELAKLLHHYATVKTIATYDPEVELALLATSPELAEAIRDMRRIRESLAQTMAGIMEANNVAVYYDAQDEEDILDDELTVGAQPERVVWVRHNDQFYTAELPSGAVLRVQWEEEDGSGWVGRFGSMYTNPQFAAVDAKDQIMAHYLDNTERDVEQLRASLP